MELNLAKAKELIEAAIAEKGADYVYPRAGASCVNVEQVQVGESEYDLVPSCIVGHAMVIAGFPIEQIWRYASEETAEELVTFMSRYGFISNVHEDAMNLLMYVQAGQDNGRPWGEVYEMALEGKCWSGYAETYAE